MLEREDENTSSFSDITSDASYQGEIERLVRQKQLKVPDLMKVGKMNRGMAQILAEWLNNPQLDTKSFHGVTKSSRKDKEYIWPLYQALRGKVTVMEEMEEGSQRYKERAFVCFIA